MKKTAIFILLGLILTSVTYSQVKVNFTLTNPRVEGGYFVYDLNAVVQSGQFWAVGSSNIRVNFVTVPANGLTVKADNPAINPNTNVHNANGYQAMTTTSVASGVAIGLNILTFNTSGFYRMNPGTQRLATIRWNRVDTTCLASMTFRVTPAQFPTTILDSLVAISYPASYTITNPPGNIPVSVMNIVGEVPRVFKLYQNYPNPFNPVTAIKFDIPKQTYMKLVIYDILGREVITLVDEKVNAGSYEMLWDAANFASGTYIYKITTDDFTDIKKMILVK
jgi:hypothetical protein